jgi:hypothetical protein
MDKPRLITSGRATRTSLTDSCSRVHPRARPWAYPRPRGPHASRLARSPWFERLVGTSRPRLARPGPPCRVLWHRIARGHRATIARRPTLSPTLPMREHPSSRSRSARKVETLRAAAPPASFWNERHFTKPPAAVIPSSGPLLWRRPQRGWWTTNRPSFRTTQELALSDQYGPFGPFPRLRASHDITPRKVDAVLLPRVLSIVSRPFRIAGGPRFCVTAWHRPLSRPFRPRFRQVWTRLTSPWLGRIRRFGLSAETAPFF